MIDDLFILALFPLIVVVVVGLRLTKPVVPVHVVVTEPEPVYVVEVRRPLGITADDVTHIFQTPAPEAYTDDTMRFPDGMLAFLYSLPDVGPGSK